MVAASLVSTLRSLRRSPGYTLLAAGTLGLGVGAAATMFTLLDQVVLRPLPVVDEAGIVIVWGRHRTRDLAHFPFTWQAWDQIRGVAGVAGLAATDAWGSSERLVDGGDRLTPVRWSRVLGDFFGVLGVAPVLGRTLTAGDDIAGGPRLAVVSYGFWMRRWGGQRSVLGSTLIVDGQPHTVVGVMPRDLDYPRGTEVWTPLRPQYADWSTAIPLLELDLIARMTASGTPASLAAGIERALLEDADLSSMYSDVSVVVRPFANVVLGDLRQVIVLLFAGGLLLLLVAATNVASLTGVRAAERGQSLAIQRALGARWWDVVGAAAVDGLVIAGLAGLVAIAILWAGLGAFLPLAPAAIPRLDTVAPDAITWIGVGLVLLVAGVMVAVVAAAVASRGADAMALLRNGVRQTGRRPYSRAALIVVQAGLALWTVAAASLLVRTLRNLGTLETGFDVSGLHVVQIDHRYANFQLPHDVPSMFKAATERMEAVPGVVAATPVLSPPLVGNSGFDIVPTLDASDRDPGDALPYLSLDLVSPGFFETLRLPILRGRVLGPQDRAGSDPAVVINEVAARALWPGAEPLGRRLILPFPGYEGVRWTVVGIAADSRYREFVTIRAAIYVPLDQMPVIAPRFLAIRTTTQVDLNEVVAVAFTGIDPSVQVVGATAVPDRMDAPLARPRFALAVLGAIALLVLMLAAVGVYGVMAASVRGRTREIGVRMACGARPADAGGLVLREALLLAGMGAAGGVAASLLTGRFIESILFDVSSGDPITLAVAALVVLATTAAACVPPALRAAATDPMTVLKES